MLPEDDAATANWGENWCIPTGSQFEELFNHTTFTSVVSNGVTGFLFTASNGNSIFLPVTGSISYDNVIYGNTGQYWSSTLLADPNYVSFLFFYSESFGSNIEMANAVRCYGHPVRPVRSVPQNNTPEGAINGLFTINANGDQVYFSKGNLQYIGSATTPYWKFADNQWDYFGDNGQGSEDLDVDRDLFGWGTSGYHDSDDPYNVNYQPWSTSMTTVNMTNNNYGYGPSINMSSFNLTSTSANYDWGVYNMINNGGNQENLWRTLTYPEWTYIFNSRNTLSDDRYAKANVNGVNGVILSSDNWNSNAFNLENTDSKEASFTSNVLTITQWNILEECGAVFLPAAGGRNRITIHDVDYQGCYWSASSANSANAARLFFYDSDLNPLSTFGRCGGQSVRLVKDYNP